MSGPGLVRATVEMTDLGWRQTIRSKLLIGIGLAILLPVGIAFLIHEYAEGSSAATDYQALQLLLLSTVVAPLVALLLGTGAMATERESGTLAYLFTRPFPRAAVVLGKGLGAIAVANVAVAAAAVGVFVASGAPANAQFGGGLLALLLETTALTAVFVLFGTVLAKSLYLGLAYIALIEGLLGNVVAARSGYTVTYHARNLLSEWSARAINREAEELLGTLPGSAAQSVLVLVVVTVAALAAAGWWVETREYGLRDRPKEE